MEEGGRKVGRRDEVREREGGRERKESMELDT